MFGPPPLITFINQFLKIPDNIWKVLHTDISNGITCFLVFIWPCFGLESHRDNQTLSWSYCIIFWIWWYGSHSVQTDKLQQDLQGDVLITTLDLYVFPNITTPINFHVHSCELTKCELSSPVKFYSQNVFRADQPW